MKKRRKGMKIKVGGSIGFKIQGRTYESIEASTVFSIEKEVPDDTPFEEIEKKFFDKTNKILEKEALKKMKIAFNAYDENMDKIRKKLDD